MRRPWPFERAFTVYCLDAHTGELLWKRGTAPRLNMVKRSGQTESVPTASMINALDCDDEHIVIGLERVSAASLENTKRFYSPVSEIRQCFSVQCFNPDGGELWRTDVGGGVIDLTIIPGVGVAVVHDHSHHSYDPLTISAPGYTGIGVVNGSFGISDGLGGARGMIGSSTPRDVETSMRQSSVFFTPALAGWDTNFRCSGGTLQAGMTFEFAEVLAGPGKLRTALYFGVGQGPTVNSDPTPVFQCASLANVTLLNIATGEPIWRTLASTPPWSVTDTFTAFNGVNGFGSDGQNGAICTDRAGKIIIYRNQPAPGFVVMDYTGSVIDDVDLDFPVVFPNRRGLACVGGAVLIGRTSVGGAKYSLGGIRDVGWSPVNGDYYFDTATSLLWGGVIGGAAPCNSATGVPVTTIRFPVGSRPMPNGKIISTTRAFDAAGRGEWRHIDTAKTNVGGTLGAACGSDRHVFVTTRGGNNFASNLEYVEAVDPWL